MARAQPENKVKKDVEEYLRIRGMCPMRINNIPMFIGGRPVSHCTVGAPDIVAILPGGFFLGVECKSATGRQRPAQRGKQLEILKAGGRYMIARSANDVDTALATWRADEKRVKHG